MNDTKPKPILPWVLFGIALIGCITIGLFLTISLALNFFSIGGSVGSDIYSSNGNVAVVEIKGVIQDSKDTVRILKKLGKDDDVKAVVLRVDSPGGSVAPSQEIYDSVRELVRIKPVVASVASVAASGGYYIIAPSTRIVANPGSITGSIGVIIELFMFRDLLKKFYLDWTVIKSGEVKDMGSPLRKLTEKEMKIFQDGVMNIHEQFKKAVSVSRKIPIQTLDKIADGRIFTGEQALGQKLVDELGGLEKAILTAASLAKIKGEPKVFYPAVGRKKFWQHLTDDMADSLAQKIEEKGYSFRPLLIMTR